jgi:predicted ester cyclase
MEPETRIRQLADALNDRDWHTYASHFTEDLITHAPGIRSLGRDARLKALHDLVAAFPDAQFTVDRIVAQDACICAEVTFEGTHTGPLASPTGTIPPTRREVTFPYCLVMRTRGEQIAEVHEYFDRVELMTQLGLLTAV